MQTKEQEDAESNARLLSALFGGAEGAEEAIEKDRDTPSSQQLDYGEDGKPLQLRFVYVDEPSCIGCTYCADVARNTFYMNDDAGRARVFNQGGDDPDVVQEAIDTCPVMCISYVDLEDLIILEGEREGMVINPASIGIPSTWSVAVNALPPTKAKMSSGAMCCNNCPGRGCKECPMYGVGMNPIYIERMEARQAKKEASGEAAAEAEDERRADAVSALFDTADAPPVVEDEDLAGMVVPTDAASFAAMEAEDDLISSEPGSNVFDALFGGPSLDDLDDDNLFADDAAVPLSVAALQAEEAAAEREAREKAEAEAAAAEEARRLEEERIETERLEAERIERERIEAAERAERERVEAEERAKAEAARELEETKQRLASLPTAKLSDFGLPVLVEGKLLEHLGKGKELRKFKFATPAIKGIAANAVAAQMEALEQAETRGKELRLDNALIRACKARREELKKDLAELQ